MWLASIIATIIRHLLPGTYATFRIPLSSANNCRMCSRLFSYLWCSTRASSPRLRFLKNSTCSLKSRVSSTLIFERGSRSFMAGLRAAHLRRNGEQNGSREIRKNRSGLATGEGYVSRVPPFSRAADYSPGLVFHAKRFIYSGISLKVSRCSPNPVSDEVAHNNGRRRTRPEAPLSFCYGDCQRRTCRRICTTGQVLHR